MIFAPSLVGLLVISEVPLPGTQPNELVNPPEPTSACNCHLSFDPDHFIEPGETFRATAMSLSARDPLFRAALKVASTDRPELSDLCIRCHAPIGWLGGRSTPGDGSALEENDLESVTCDTCHRMVPTSTLTAPRQLIGDGQYSISADTAKRAHRGHGPENGHRVHASDFIGTSEMCGACHSLFNPDESAHDAAGHDLGFPYYEQRTYEEWKDSWYAATSTLAGGKTCAGCHMKRVRGKPARSGMTYDDMALHAIVGANDFVAQAVNLVDPLFPLDQELPNILPLIEESLRSAAKLTITSTLAHLVAAHSGDTVDIAVRLENLTGHKLPTGYPEGRRVYLEVSLALGGKTSTISGAWDPATGVLIEDPQLRTYETQHGRVEAGTSTRTHHLFRMNQVRIDTRIPPRGFGPSFPDMIPVGRAYGGSSPYQNYDDVTYHVVMPEVETTTTATVTIRAKYQVTDGEVVRFLGLASGPGSPESNAILTAYEGLGHVPPKLIAEVSVPVEVSRRPEVPPVPDSGGGCSCSAARASGVREGTSLCGVIAAFVVLLRSCRRRGADRRRRASS